MPRVSQFYGVSIYMYFHDHAPPHFHAIHGAEEAVITINPPALHQGALPGASLKRILTWTALHQAELQANWQRAQSGQPLRQIPPLP
jgi:hypothetical protein